jgi:uncharacterized protein YacL
LNLRKKLFILLLAVLGGVAFGIVAPSVYEWIALRLFEAERQRQAVGNNVFPDQADIPTMNNAFNTVAFALLGIVLGAVVARLLVFLGEKSSEWWEQMESGGKVTLFLGTFMGLMLSMPFLLLLNSMSLGVYIPVAVVGLTVGFASLSVYALRSMDELLPWNRGGRGRGKRTGLKILDTNVLIDGRIYDVVRTGFVEAQLYVPGFVLEELQYIADSHDPLRRQRGRRGLDILRHLEADYNTEVRIHDKLAPDLSDGVDSRLIRLARAVGGDIITNDFNLNRVAGLQQVRVLNINDLALAMRPNVLPGESLTLSILREGNQPGQGVGYLEDGTMVVVENGKEHIGETMDVGVTQVIQTERGKMVFAEVPNGNSDVSDLKRRATPRRV